MGTKMQIIRNAIRVINLLSLVYYTIYEETKKNAKKINGKLGEGGIRKYVLDFSDKRLKKITRSCRYRLLFIYIYIYKVSLFAFLLFEKGKDSNN